MADNLQIDEGTSGKYAETTDLGSGVHRPGVLVKNTSIAGTAGTPNAGVLSVQGIASMTPVQVTVNSITAGDNNIGNVDIVTVPVLTVDKCIQWTNVSQEYTSAQTSADIVAASGAMKFYIGRILVSAGYVASATACTVRIYLGTGAYAAGTDQLVFGGEFATIPATGLVSYPGAIIGNGGAPFTISAASDALKITTVSSTHPRIYVSVDYIRV